MKWTQPIYLILLSALPVVLLLTVATERYLQRVRTVWGGQNPTLHWRSWLRLVLVIMLLILLPVALGGLAVEVRSAQNAHNNVALAIGLDVSKSMLAEDVLVTLNPDRIANRLNVGRTLIDDLITRLCGEKIGLFFFARNGIEVVALTRDHGFIRYVLRHTDMARLTESGSDLLAAVNTANAMLAGSGDHAVEAVILITDGEDTENSLEQTAQTIQQLSPKSRPVYTIRVGGEDSVLIPIRKAGIPGIDGFYTDEEGNHLQTCASDKWLQYLSSATQGRSWHYPGDGSELAQRVVEQILTHARQSSPGSLMVMSWLDLSGLFLLLAAFCYALYELL